MDPFTSRFAKRFFVVVGCFIGGLVLFSILNLPDLIIIPVAGSMFGVPIYFVMQDKKAKNQCIEIIRNKYNQTSILTVEVYHHSDFGWGFLTLTKEALIFVPKKGDIINIPHSNYSDYGYKGLGTGNYITTSSRIGNTNMSINNTSEKKAPVFYIAAQNGNETHFHTRKNKQMFNALRKVRGEDNSNLKSNY